LSTLLQPRPKSTATANKVLDELDVYLKEPLAKNEEGEFDLSFSPVQYWKMNEHRFPALAPIARDVMGVPASSANIKRAFRTAVDIKSAKRNKIKAALFQMLLFIKKNFYLLSLKLK
jgi:hypothetical protein